MIVDRGVTVSDQLTLVLCHSASDIFSRICLLSEAMHQQAENLLTH